MGSTSQRLFRSNDHVLEWPSNRCLTGAMVTLVLVILRLSLYCAAFAWPRGPSQSPSVTHPIVDSAEDELTGLLSSQAALENYARRPDCFRRVAAKIRMRCADLEVNEDERVKAAISMTLCELATATHHSLPLECAAFTVDSEPSPNHEGGCVDALSRSAQFWSSYSGYLREETTYVAIDTAKDIYRNSTLEAMALIRFLLARERPTWPARIAGLLTFRSELEEIALRLKTMSEVMDTTMRDVAPQLKNELTTILDTFSIGMVDIRMNDRREYSRIIEEHSHSLNALVPAIEGSLDSLNNALSPFQTQSLQALDLAVRFQSLSMHELSEGASHTATILDSSAGQAQMIYNAQLVASSSASDLAETLNRLTTTTHAELEKINSTAHLLTESLVPRPQVTILPDLMRLMEIVLRIDPSTILYLRHLPVFRFLSALCSCLLYLSRSSFSALMVSQHLWMTAKPILI
ncbi:hypothetical protein B0H10DRAFT_2058042 [Mycena sp. CBHHK59/15]|nr:hypothetical protein B0H10DRAFT_2058042 [Mycena sp. CBHHK59/15]